MVTNHVTQELICIESVQDHKIGKGGSIRRQGDLRIDQSAVVNKKKLAPLRYQSLYRYTAVFGAIQVHFDSASRIILRISDSLSPITMFVSLLHCYRNPKTYLLCLCSSPRSRQVRLVMRSPYIIRSSRVLTTGRWNASALALILLIASDSLFAPFTS